MPTALETQEVLPSFYTWQAFCSPAKVELTSHAIELAGKIYLIDPIRLGKSALTQFEGKVAAILLTNGNHERDAAFYQKYFHAPVFASQEARAELSITTEDFPNDLGGLKIIPLPGAGPGEVAVYDPERLILCVGDIIINLDSLEFAPLPNKYATDRKRMRESLRSLTTLEVSVIGFAHGTPVTNRAKEKLVSLIS